MQWTAAEFAYLVHTQEAVLNGIEMDFADKLPFETDLAMDNLAWYTDFGGLIVVYWTETVRHQYERMSKVEIL